MVTLHLNIQRIFRTLSKSTFLSAATHRLTWSNREPKQNFRFTMYLHLHSTNTVHYF